MLVMENTRNGLVVVESGDRTPTEVLYEIQAKDNIECIVDEMELWGVSIHDLKVEIERRCTKSKQYGDLSYFHQRTEREIERRNNGQ